MKKEELLKLAEIAGKEHRSDDDGAMYLNDPRYTNHWTIPWLPHEDLNQAMECVDGTDTIVDMEIVKIGSKGFAVYLYGPVVGGDSIPWPKLSVKGEGETRAEAICKAVLKAVRG